MTARLRGKPLGPQIPASEVRVLALSPSYRVAANSCRSVNLESSWFHYTSYSYIEKARKTLMRKDLRANYLLNILL